MSMHLQRQITKLKKMILSLGAMVEENYEKAVRAVEHRDINLADEVVQNDRQIDLAEIDVEEECLHTLALHQPVAFDLRFVVAVLKINNDLERIGDLAVNVAEQARFLAGEEQLDRFPYDVTAMSQVVQAMVKGCLDALVNIDVALAEQIRERDDEVDDMHRHACDSVERALHTDPQHASQLMHLATIARQLERIADHAVNVTKDVIYMAKGDIVRHNRREKKLAAMRAAEGR